MNTIESTQMVKLNKENDKSKKRTIPIGVMAHIFSFCTFTELFDTICRLSSKHRQLLIRNHNLNQKRVLNIKFDSNLQIKEVNLNYLLKVCTGVKLDIFFFDHYHFRILHDTLYPYQHLLWAVTFNILGTLNSYKLDLQRVIYAFEHPESENEYDDWEHNEISIRESFDKGWQERIEINMMSDDKEATSQTSYLLANLKECQILQITDKHQSLCLILSLEARLDNYQEIYCKVNALSNYELEFLYNFQQLKLLHITAQNTPLYTKFSLVNLKHLERLTLDCVEKSFYDYQKFEFGPNLQHLTLINEAEFTLYQMLYFISIHCIKQSDIYIDKLELTSDFESRITFDGSTTDISIQTTQPAFDFQLVDHRREKRPNQSSSGINAQELGYVLRFEYVNSDHQCDGYDEKFGISIYSKNIGYRS